MNKKIKSLKEIKNAEKESRIETKTIKNKDGYQIEKYVLSENNCSFDSLKKV